jgi:hypothetical protein
MHFEEKIFNFFSTHGTRCLFMMNGGHAITRKLWDASNKNTSLMMVKKWLMIIVLKHLNLNKKKLITQNRL